MNSRPYENSEHVNKYELFTRCCVVGGHSLGRCCLVFDNKTQQKVFDLRMVSSN